MIKMHYAAIVEENVVGHAVTGYIARKLFPDATICRLRHSEDYVLGIDPLVDHNGMPTDEFGDAVAIICYGQAN